MVRCSFCNKIQTEVEQLIAGPAHDHDGTKPYICDECVNLCHDILEQQRPNASSALTSLNEEITPENIKKYLDQYVIGQHHSKEILSVAVYNHYKRINTDEYLEKSNILMVGPSGVGKTYLVKTIAKYLSLPVAITDATSLTETGYVGDDVEGILERLIQNADNDVELAQKGIIYIDEIDKKVAKDGAGMSNRDVSGKGVQQSLLKLVEGSTVKVPTKNFKMTGETIDFDTTNVLFIVGGAFVDLDNIIERDIGNVGSIGFSADPSKSQEFDILKHVKPSHLIQYGMIPEFIGRFPILAPLHYLDEDALIKILTKTKHNLLEQFKTSFKLNDVLLSFSDKFVKDVAQECIKQDIGARGLKSVLEKTLLKTQFKLPTLSSQGIKEIYVDEFDKIELHKKKQKMVNKE